MPTSFDQQLDEEIPAVAKSLGSFRVEVAEKCWTTDARLEAFRSEVVTNLKYICWIGMFFITLLIVLFLSAVTLAWKSSALESDVMHQNQYLNDVRAEVKDHGERLQKIERRMDRLEGRIDGIGKQLEVLIQSGETKSGGLIGPP